jgi:hypothetical protein
MDIREKLRLIRLRAAVVLSRSREARARATHALEYARLLRRDSDDLRGLRDDLRGTGKPPEQS